MAQEKKIKQCQMSAMHMTHDTETISFSILNSVESVSIFLVHKCTLVSGTAELELHECINSKIR